MPYRTLKVHDWFHPDGFPIAVERREPQSPFGMHAHEFNELVLVTSGRGLHVTPSESWPLAAGDVFIIGGARRHTYEAMEHLCLVNVLYLPERLQFDRFDLHSLPGYRALFSLEPVWRRRHHFASRLHLSPPQLRRALSLVDQLQAELDQRHPGFGFLATAAFMQLTGYLARAYAENPNPDSRALLRIAESIGHLERNFHEPLRLRDLAAIAHMSPRSFLRAFHAATASSPIAYLIQLRVNHAARLLRTSSHSITDVAFQAGFTDSNYFTRQFRRLTGLSPRRYRDQSSAQPPQSSATL